MTDESKSLKIVRNVAVGERRDRSSQVVGGVSARDRQSSLGSIDVDNELVDSSDRSSHCNQRAGSENERLRVTERSENGRHSETWSVVERFGTPS